MRVEQTEYVVIGIYLILLIAMGAVFKRFNKNTEDYFKSGSQATWWLVGMSSLMSGVSALTFTGNAGKAYEAGFSVLVIYFASTIGFLFQGLFLGAWFRHLRATTYPEVVDLRHGRLTHMIYAYTSVVYFYLGAALWLWGLAIFSSSLFGFSIYWTIVGLGLVVLLYSTTGGSWAVMATDFVQSLILLPMTLLLTYLSLKEIGGISAFFTKLNEAGLSEPYAIINEPGAFPNDANSWSWALATVVVFSLGHLSLGSANKYFSVKDGKSAQWAAYFSCITITAGALFWFIPPMVGRLLFSEEIANAPLSNPAEASYAITALHLLPSGMIGLMVVAMFSATMSSMDTGLNRNAAIIARDITPHLMSLLGKRPLKEQQSLLLSKIATVLSGFIVIGVAIAFASSAGPGGMFKVLLDVMTAIGVPKALPMVLGLFVKRVPRWAAIFTMGVGIIPSLVFAVGGFELTFQTRAFVILGVSTGAFFFTGLFWRRETQAYREQVDSFFKRMKTPVDFKKEVQRDTDHLQMRIIGGFTLVIAIFVLILSYIQTDKLGLICVLLLGGVLLVFAIFMLLCSRKKGEVGRGI
ncbi:MAG: hypothetical protein AAF558_00890 [Verrucomicrobiota bacterium]